MKKKEDMIAKQRRGEENIIDFYPKSFTLFIDGGEEAKRFQFKILVLEKSIHVSRSSVNQISRIPTISATRS